MSRLSKMGFSPLRTKKNIQMKYINEYIYWVFVPSILFKFSSFQKEKSEQWKVINKKLPPNRLLLLKTTYT